MDFMKFVKWVCLLIYECILMWIFGINIIVVGNLKIYMKIYLGEKLFYCNVENCLKLFRSNEVLRRYKMLYLGK